MVVLAMLQNQQSVFLQEALLENACRDAFQVFQGVGWVGKDEIELLMAFFDVFEDIGFGWRGCVYHDSRTGRCPVGALGDEVLSG